MRRSKAFPRKGKSFYTAPSDLRTRHKFISIIKYDCGQLRLGQWIQKIGEKKGNTNLRNVLTSLFNSIKFRSCHFFSSVALLDDHQQHCTRISCQKSAIFVSLFIHFSFSLNSDEFTSIQID